MPGNEGGPKSSSTSSSSSSSSSGGGGGVPSGFRRKRPSSSSSSSSSYTNGDRSLVLSKKKKKMKQAHRNRPFMRHFQTPGAVGKGRHQSVPLPSSSSSSSPSLVQSKRAVVAAPAGKMSASSIISRSFSSKSRNKKTTMKRVVKSRSIGSGSGSGIGGCESRSSRRTSSAVSWGEKKMKSIRTVDQPDNQPNMGFLQTPSEDFNSQRSITKLFESSIEELKVPAKVYGTTRNPSSTSKVSSSPSDLAVPPSDAHSEGHDRQSSHLSVSAPDLHVLSSVSNSSLSGSESHSLSRISDLNPSTGSAQALDIDSFSSDDGMEESASPTRLGEEEELHEPDRISSCEAQASPLLSDDESDSLNPYRPCTQALYSPERAKREQKRRSRRFLRTSFSGAILPGSPSATPKGSSQASVRSASGFPLQNSASVGGDVPNRDSRSDLKRSPSSSLPVGVESGEDEHNITSLCSSVLQKKQGSLKNRRHSFRRVARSTHTKGRGTSKRRNSLDNVSNDLSFSKFDETQNVAVRSKIVQKRKPPFSTSLGSPLASGRKKSWLDSNRSRINAGKCGELARQLLQAHAEVNRKANRFKLERGNSRRVPGSVVPFSTAATSTPSFISRSWAAPRAGAYLVLEIEEIIGCRSLHVVARCTCLQVTAPDEKICKMSENSVSVGSKVEIVFPSNSIGLVGLDASLIQAGFKIRTYEPWVCVPKQRRSSQQDKGAKSQWDLLVASQLVEVDTAS